jgi:membrane-associated phospholipid phosphatase
LLRRQASPPGVATVSRFALVAGLAALAGFIALSAVASTHSVTSWEQDAVEVIVDLPAWLMFVPRALMHISTRFTVPVLALLAYAVTLRWRASAAVMAALAVGAVPAWAGKHLVSDRPRPVRLQDIPARDDFYGSGYPSGHGMIAFATAVIVPL